MKAALRWLTGRLARANHGLRYFRRETGQSLWLWLIMALLNLAMQIVLRRELLPGEFGIFNTALGVMALMTVPVFSLQQAGALFRPEVEDPVRLAALRDGRGPLLQNFTWIWIGVASVLLIPIFILIGPPRPSLGAFTWVNVVLALGAYAGAAIYEETGRAWLWSLLIFIGAALRLLLVVFFTSAEPLTETALGAMALAGMIKLLPLLRQTKMIFAWKRTWAAARDREFQLYFLATLSAMLGVFLFSSADRIIAEGWFGRPHNNNLGMVPWGLFDGYQTAGVLGRGLLWGTQPLLFLLLAQRARQEHTTRLGRRIFWIYLGTLLAGAVFLYLMAVPLSRLFGGANQGLTAYYIPLFAQAMVPMGLLQGLGFFAIASRRYPECFLIGAMGLAYALLLSLAGRPQVILSYIFGGGVVALMLILFVGVVRWGRKQP